MRRSVGLLIAGAVCLLLGAGCQPAKKDGDKPTPKDDDTKTELKTDDTKTAKPALATTDDGTKPGEKKVQPLVPAAQAPSASPRMPGQPVAEEMVKKTNSYYEGRIGRRIYIQVDKPLYKPGETIWIRTWDLRKRDLSAEGASAGIRYQLVSPRGAVVLRKRVKHENSMTTNDFVIPEGVKGGEYKIRAIALDGTKEEKPVIISTYEPPRVKKKLEFVRKAYGAGDTVSATIAVKRPTGEPLANHPLVAAVTLDGQDLPRVKLTTNDKGGGVVKFALPKVIELGDGLLTVLVEDGGVTESVSKRIPIVLKKVRFSLFPEGGKMVAGLPTRVYFSAKNTLGKPADVEGKIVDDHGNAVATFKSFFHGMGRFEFTPSTGRTYKAQITRPVGVKEQFSLPLAEDKGCVLNAYDDVDGQADALRVSVRCTDTRKVTVVGMLRENLVDAATVQVPEGEPAVVYLIHKDPKVNKAQGVVRVTVFDGEKNPLAERLVYRNRRSLLSVKVKPHKESYAPRDQVTLTVSTHDAAGKPVPAELALSVVDDTVVSFADDKTGHMLSRLYLEPEIPGKVEEPKKFFDLTDKKSGRALDLLVGTRGWRAFSWTTVFNPPPPMPITGAGYGSGAGQPKGGIIRRALGGLGLKGVGRGGGGAKRKRGRRPAMEEAEGQDDLVAAARPMPRAVKAPMAAPKPAAAPPAPADQPAGREQVVADPRPEPVVAARAARRRAPRRIMAQEPPAMDRVMANKQDKAMIAGKDKEWAKAEEKKRIAPAWAPVRVFPAPTYTADYSGPRTDFRETIFWNPKVATGKDGQATVSFYLSDAVTSFRVFSEGIGAGMAGRDESVVKSALPFSMAVKLPLEVSAGDQLNLPLTLTNETDRSLGVTVDAAFGELLKLDDAGHVNRSVELPAGERKTLMYPVKVTGVQGKSAVRIAAKAGTLSDEFTRTVTVVPVGFPQQISLSGQVKDQVKHEVDLGKAVPGSAVVSVRLYPSPVSSMLSGLDGMLRQPCGCFEQASSSNYPNVMIMRYLKEHNVDDPALLDRSGKLLDAGYRKLVGYESPKRGYEWFGGNPGHEALTAYGLLEFADMKAVFGSVDDTMIKRTAAWLKSRRDGKGGFKRNARALDSFGRASDEVTAAYIMYSLTEAGFVDGFDKEIDNVARLARSTKDAYILALSANTLLNLAKHKAAGKAAANRLAAMQDSSGAWTGADHSITRSSGQNLYVETTALSVMALLKADVAAGKVRNAMIWLVKNRGGYGRWGATQATVLGLKAMAAYARASRKTRHPGTVVIKVGGKVVGKMDYQAGRREPMLFEGLGKHFGEGKNELVISHDGKGELPYSVAATFRSAKPASSPDCVVGLITELKKSAVKMGENVRLTATVKNTTDRGQPMTLVRVGLPGGLTFQTWQLKELRDKKLIAFYETRAREVILYLRQLKPGESRALPLDLVATVPGSYTGPASSAYLYYTDDQKVWTDPAKFTVSR